MAPPADHDGALRWVREAYVASGDETGVHLCDLARVVGATDQGPEAVVRAVGAPLQRMVSAGSVFGVDVLGGELLVAALQLEHEELRKATTALVARSGRREVVARVVTRVLEGARSHEVAGRMASAVRYTEAALEVAVGAGDYQAGAATLLHLADLHARGQRMEVARLCRQQAAVYLERGGLTEDAAGVRLRIAADAPEADATAEVLAAATVFESVEPARSCDLWLRLAERELSKSQARATLAGLRRSARSELAMDDGALEARIWRAMAQVHGRLGDDEMAESCRARAELIAPGSSEAEPRDEGPR